MRNVPDIDYLNDLIEKAQMGSVIAFTSIVKLHQQYAYAVAFKILCDEENSKDVVQESFIRIWKHIADYNPKSKFTTWMYKIVVNLCYDKLRHIKRQKNLIELSIDNPDVLANDDNPELKLSNKEIAGLIIKISYDLSEKQRIIFVLRDLEELSINEVSEITGMSESSVKTNLLYARRKIKEKLIRMV
jgi:RNA polymerase sigma-70 factor, ECF subfamily